MTERNIAEGKPVTQSSQSGLNRPDLAVDGLLETDVRILSSLNTPQWWQVDLEVSHFVTYVIFYNPKDACK